jgi:hypothetical protein
MCLIGHNRTPLEAEPIGRSVAAADIQVVLATPRPAIGTAQVPADIVPMEQTSQLGIIRLD